jgi:hypothetical protein
MILNRLAQGIKQQDWYTVLLEILIVVVGIFIGLQVDDWNTARLERQEERAYLQRIQLELADYIEAFEASKLRREIHNNNLTSFSDALYGRSERTELTDAECNAITSSHILEIFVPDLPVITEIMSSGRMHLFRDAEMRAAIAASQQAKERLQQLIDDNSSESFNMRARFPDLIRVVSFYDEETNDVRALPSCNLAGMQDSQAFKNEASTNLDIYDAFFNKRLSSYSDRLTKLQQLVDAAL